MSENITPFADSGPNNLSVKMSIKHVPVRVHPQQIDIDPTKFAQYVVKTICGIINEKYSESWSVKVITPDLVLGRCQRQPAAKARHLVTRILRDFGWSFLKIGEFLDRDHTSVMSGYHRSIGLLERHTVFRLVHRDVMDRLGSRGFVTGGLWVI